MTEVTPVARSRPIQQGPERPMLESMLDRLHVALRDHPHDPGVGTPFAAISTCCVRRRTAPSACDEREPGEGPWTRKRHYVRLSARVWPTFVRPKVAAPRQESGGARRACAASSSCAGATTQLRVLRQGPAPDRSGRDDLHLRVHLLPRLRRHEPARGVSQLRRRLHSPSDPPTSGPQPPSRVNGPRTRPRLPARRVTRARHASPTPQSEESSQELSRGGGASFRRLSVPCQHPDLPRWVRRVKHGARLRLTARG